MGVDLVGVDLEGRYHDGMPRVLHWSNNYRADNSAYKEGAATTTE